MSLFLRLLAESDKDAALAEVCACWREGRPDERLIEVAPKAFDAVPGKPFAYWVSEAVRNVFSNTPAVEKRFLVASGTGTLDDFRFLRCWWEIPVLCDWYVYAKGGAYSPVYYDHYLLVNWALDGAEMKEWIIYRYQGGHWARNIRSTEHYFRPGLTWPRRTQGGLSLRAMPMGCIFADKGPAAFVAGDDPDALLALLALTNSAAFILLVSLQMAFGSYEVGVIQKTPLPELSPENTARFAALARRAWALKRRLDTTTETSHAFLLPAALRARAGDFDPPAIEAELADIQAQIDTLAFELYGFSGADRQAVADVDAMTETAQPANGDEESEEGDESAASEAAAPPLEALLSWAVGVAFGRFDWRLATGERPVPPDPQPFDPLPAKSPGMLPDGAKPFHAHPGILVDDPGHPHDLARLVEEVLIRVNTPVPDDVRRFLQGDFFAFHLKTHSRSRRKAPIYWPLATASGRYTLWLYYPDLSDQTLYTAINDFVEPKLQEISAAVSTLRQKAAARTRDDETAFESLQGFEVELIELRDTLLKLAPAYHPHFDDGVQLSAAPLMPLFRHKRWQRILKETRTKLARGNYDWSHLAMNYWSERVRERCHIDKSLAIAHGLEYLYFESETAPRKKLAKKGDSNE